MKLPKTAKGFLKLLISICDTEVESLSGLSKDGSDSDFIRYIIAQIQNSLGEDEWGTMKKKNLEW